MVFLTVDEVAERLRVSRNWVAERVATGEIPSYRLGRLVRVDALDFERWVGGQRSINGECGETEASRAPHSSEPLGELDG